MMFGRTKKELTLQFQPADSSVVAEVDGSQIEQVLLNMFVNSWQAMPKGSGSITVQTALTDLDEKFCAPYEIAPGRYIRISVADSGMGMDDSVRARIFDPFFTTKVHERGTGLGLASAHGIVTNHQGCITVESSQGKGTTFEIFLPASGQTPVQRKTTETGIHGGTERILLVDDEEMIIDVGEAILERLGYTVLVARGGREAISLVEEHGEAIRLVLLDMIMPGMDGGETFDALRQLYPSLPVILSSGYTMNGLATEILQRGCNGFIQKPFSLSELSQKIRSVLDDQEITSRTAGTQPKETVRNPSGR